ncbi:MAG: CRISPR-associated endonuclease Cas3'' [Nitrococcus sp.]|nr:CRISPR-associated endonuclease Cas3'' [Nitrococcus sp.]
MTNDADVLGLPSESDEKTSSKHRGVLWRGAQRSSVLSSPRDLKPGDTLVLPCRDAASRALAHLPSPDDTPSETPLISDVGDEASAQARDKAVLRIHPALRSAYPECMAVNELFGAACREEAPTKAQWSELLASTAEALEDTHAKLRERVQALAGSSIRIEIYPDHQGVILTSRKRLSGPTDWYIRAMDEGDDESSRTEGKESVSLADHSIHVRDMAKVSLQHLSLEALNTTTVNAAFMHDWGKADERFQAMLRRTDRTDAWLYAGAKRLLLAKSDGVPMTQSQRKAARERAGMPEGFRHEMLSLQLAESSSNLPAEPHQKELALHLIASHHGYARPFAPVVDDTELPSVAFDDSQLTHEDRLQLVPAHRLDSGVGERFWTLTRRYGWWGLAYLEAVLRLADQQASAAENAGSYDTNKDSIEHLEEMI